MKGKYIKGRKVTYDGTQLRSLWAFTQHNVQGDSIVAFRGPADVSGANLVDLVDAKAGKFIKSDEMVHFITEFFDSDLPRTVALRRLLIMIIKEVIEEIKPEIFVERKGNDLFIEVDEEGVDYRKLSVSIATASPVSTLIHVGVNVTSENTPVPTFGLNDLEVPVEELVLKVMQKFITEIKEMELERTKVRGVP
jgi:uncharacterized protein